MAASRRRFLAVAAGGMTALSCRSFAQAAYPDRPIHLIVPYGAGGVADVGMRILGEKLGVRLKQQIVIENRPGAGGILAAQAALSAPPDGYTILMTGNHNAIAASLFTSLPYSILNDFNPVSSVSFFDLLIVTRANSGFSSLSDVVAKARSEPGRLNVATTAPGSTQNLAAVLFGNVIGAKLTIVPYKTSPEIATGLLRGDVDVAFEFYSAVAGPIADRKIAVLASAGAERVAYLDRVPTVAESGIGNYQVQSWNGISLPKGAPQQVAAVLNRAINDVLPSADLQERAAGMGMQMKGSTPEGLADLTRRDIAKWAAVIQQANIPKQN